MNPNTKLPIHRINQFTQFPQLTRKNINSRRKNSRSEKHIPLPILPAHREVHPIRDIPANTTGKGPEDDHGRSE